MKKDKLYTSNKWNQPLFARGVDRKRNNIYDTAGPIYNINDNFFSPQGQWGNPASEYLINSGQGLDLGSGTLPSGYTIPTPSTLGTLSRVATPALKTGLFKNLAGGLKGAGLGLAGSIGNQLANKVISGGFNTGVGNGIANVGNTVGQLASNIPGIGQLAGLAIQVGSGALGGLWNHSFGMKTDENKLNAMNTNAANARTVGNQLFNAKDNAGFLDAAGNMASALAYNPYTGGWFRKGDARKKNRGVNNSQRAAMNFQTNGLVHGVNSVDATRDDLAQINSAAYGGALDMIGNMGDMGVIQYDMLDRYLTSKDRQAASKDTIKGISPVSVFEDGGEIHIKHPGRLTELKKRTGKTEAELWAEGRPEVRKMITFARNARKWQKAYGGFLNAADNLFALGGDIQAHGADFTTGSTHIDKGGTHEENPYDGIQVGVDSEGKPNLVEEGEVIYNDYVYSQRIQLDDEAKKKFHISKKRDITYAEMAKKLEKEISERPNDPISKAGFKEQMEDLAEEQERQKAEMDAEKAREAFEALSPEEQVELMQYAGEQEQQEADAQAQQEAMIQQQGMMPQQMTPEEAMQAQMMQGQGGVPPETMMQEAPMAYGGLVNRFDYGGALDWLNKNHPKLNNKEAIAKALWKHMSSDLGRYTKWHGGDRNAITYKNGKAVYDESKKYYDYEQAFGYMMPTIVATREKHFNDWIKAGLDRETAYNLVFGDRGNAVRLGEELIWDRDYERLVYQPDTASKSQKRRSRVSYVGANGKKYNTLEEANASYKNTGSEQRKPFKNNKTGETFATREEAERSVDEYNRNNKLGKYREKATASSALNTPEEQAKAQVATTPQREMGNTGNPPRRVSQTTPVASVSSPEVLDAMGLHPYDWYRNGSDGYSEPTGFKVGSNGLIRDEDYTQEYRDLVGKLTADDIRAWAKDHPQDTSLLSFLARGNKLEDLTTDQWRKGALDGKYGFMHHVADKILNDNSPETPENAGKIPDGSQGTIFLDNNGTYTKMDVPGPNDILSQTMPSEYGDIQIYRRKPGRELHKIDGGDYLPDNRNGWVNVGDEIRRFTDDNGDTVIVHAPKTPDGGNEAAAVVDTVEDKAPWKYRHTYFGPGDMGPIVALGMQAAGIGKPNLQNLERGLNILSSQGASTANYKPIGNYLRYNPMDVWAEMNRMAATSRGTQNAIRNNAGPLGTQMAGMVANSHADQVANNDLYRKALEYDNTLMNQTATFNRLTDQFNADAYNRTALTNAEIRNRDRQLRAQLGLQTELEKAATRASWYNGIYGNINNFFKGLGAHDKENRIGDMIAGMINNRVFGTVGDEAPIGLGSGYYQEKKNTGANGGKVNRRKRRKGGLTY